ncbi:MAG: hypothetical protein WA113_04150 [Desulfitobacteriaceae bacterium]
MERLDGFAEETARKTIRFKKDCVERALENGCKPAEDALKRDGALVSNDSIARYIKVESAKQIESNKYRNTLKILELADQGVKTADIANTLNIQLKDVRLLRRTAVSTLDYIEEKMKSRINSANESIL